MAQPHPIRKSVRLRNYDYRQSGAYYLTICANRKSCVFGEIRRGKMILNDLGMLTHRLWRQIAVKRPNVELDAFVVMPNHLHGIIMIVDDKSTEGSGERKERQCRRSETLVSGSLGAIVGQFKRAVSISSNTLDQAPEQPIWQRNYYEHVIRSERSLTEIREYILENPARWSEDDLYVG